MVFAKEKLGPPLPVRKVGKVGEISFALATTTREHYGSRRAYFMSETTPNALVDTTEVPIGKRLLWFCVAWLPILLGTEGLVLFMIRPTAGLARFLAGPCGLLASWGACVVLHELGHLAFAWCFSLRPLTVSIGSGPKLWDGRVFGVYWTIKAVPLNGYVWVWPTPEKAARWRMLLTVAAGPAMNALMAAVAALATRSSPKSWILVRADDSSYVFFMLIFLMNFYSLISSLIPRYVIDEGRPTPTDGMQLVQLIVGSHWTSDMRKRLKQVAASAEPKDSSSAWQEMVDSGHGEELLRKYQQVLKRPGIPHDLRCELLDTFVTGVLMLGAMEFIEEADGYSKELFLSKPAELTVKGTRGSVLVEKGELEEGSGLLREVVENDPLAYDRAIAAAYLGLVEIKRGETKTAISWLDKAREFDPRCLPLKRFEKRFALLRAPDGIGPSARNGDDDSRQNPRNE